MFRILVLDNCDKTCVDILSSVGEVDVKPAQTNESLIKILPQYDALVVRSATKVTAEAIQEAAGRLKIVGRAGVGVDNIAVAAATKCGVFVVNSPKGNTVAAAEHTVGLLLSLVRNISAGHSSLLAGRWDRQKFVGRQLQNKVLGIVGLGQVGSHVATICSAFGMELVCYDPYLNKTRAQDLGCKPVDTLSELLAIADVVTLHIPLQPNSTKPLIGKDELELMKPSAFLLNTSRGGLVDEIALCEALKNKVIAGAALDVFVKEKAMDPATTPLLDPELMGKLVLTPHLGASTTEAQINVAIDVAQQIKKTLEGGYPHAAVNLAGIRPDDLCGMTVPLELAQTLGSVAAQLISSDGAVEGVTVQVQGPNLVGLPSVEPLVLAAASGALSVCVTAGRVNFVNVKAVAAERGVELNLLKKSNGPNVLTVRVYTNTGSLEVSGSITMDGGLLLTSVDGIPVYILLKSGNDYCIATDDSDDSTIVTENSAANIKSLEGGKYIYTKHHDQPTVLANICAKLGSLDVNIGNCHLGRLPGSKLGLAIFQVDGCLDLAATLEQVKTVPAVKECKTFVIL